MRSTLPANGPGISPLSLRFCDLGFAVLVIMPLLAPLRGRQAPDVVIHQSVPQYAVRRFDRPSDDPDQLAVPAGANRRELLEKWIGPPLTDLAIVGHLGTTSPAVLAFPRCRAGALGLRRLALQL
jgi:hypothetical protein